MRQNLFLIALLCACTFGINGRQSKPHTLSKSTRSLLSRTFLTIALFPYLSKEHARAMDIKIDMSTALGTKLGHSVNQTKDFVAPQNQGSSESSLYEYLKTPQPEQVLPMTHGVNK